MQSWYFVALEFLDILKDYEKQPRPFFQIYADVAELLNKEEALLGGFEQFLRETFPRQHAYLEKCASARRQLVCGVQNSRLLSLPREIRDNIWEEVVTANIFHISKIQDADGETETAETQETEGTQESGEIEENVSPTSRQRPIRYQYHACRSHNGSSSSACPAAMGDHIECLNSGPSKHPWCPAINLVCKQILLELPKSKGTLFSENALQFDNLQTAESFLFGLSEPQRSSIQHLKLAIPLDLVYTYEYNYQKPEFARSWTAIMNYFSVPWRRRSVCHSPTRSFISPRFYGLHILPMLR